MKNLGLEERRNLLLRSLAVVLVITIVASAYFVLQPRIPPLQEASQPSPTPGLPPLPEQPAPAPDPAPQPQQPGPRQALAQLQQSAKCDGRLTPSRIEGPYYKSGSPELRTLVVSGVAGTKLTISGYVFNKACQPVAGARLDFWQADDDGNYDNVGFKLREHQFTDGTGRYYLETVVPGYYQGRTRHMHVKVQSQEGFPILTTQLFFAGDPRNQNDSILLPVLVMEVQDTADGRVATFNFVLDTE